MKQDEIIEMTRQAGGFSPTPEFLEAFAKLVEERAAAKEREACAKVCDGWTHADGDRCAEAIRAIGEA